MKFDNAEQFREVVKRYAITRRVPVRFKRNEAGRIRVVCKSGWKWILFAIKNPIESCFQLKRYQSVHSCYKTNEIKLANCKCIAK